MRRDAIDCSSERKERERKERKETLIDRNRKKGDARTENEPKRGRKKT
jgi:hypothetical protein